MPIPWAPDHAGLVWTRTSNTCHFLMLDGEVRFQIVDVDRAFSIWKDGSLVEDRFVFTDLGAAKRWCEEQAIPMLVTRKLLS